MQTSVTNEIVTEILSRYSIGTLVSFEYIPIGVSSENYRLETSIGVYFLKKHRASIISRIDSMEHVEQFFAKHDLPVVCGITTKQDSLHTIIGDSCYAIYPYVTGLVFKEGDISDSIAKNMGEMQAKMHLLTKDGIRDPYHDVSVYFTPRKASVILGEIEVLLKHISTLDAKTEYDLLAEKGLNLKKRLLIQYSSEIDAFTFDKLNLGHGDYHPGNIFFDQQLNITAIFDLDMAGPMPRIFDLNRSVMLSCLERDYSDAPIKQAGLFLKSYYDLYPFSEEELAKAMESFYFKYFSPWRESAHYLDHDVRTDDSYHMVLSSMQYLEQHRKELVKRLYTLATGKS